MGLELTGKKILLRLRANSRLVLCVLVVPIVLLLVAVPLAMSYGPLVPWSPVHPGYERLTLSRARILHPAGLALPAPYRYVDDWIAEGELFHDLPVTQRITIVLCRNWNDFNRFVPWLPGNAVAGVTLATGDTIYITPKVDERHLDHGEFLRHEISHAVLAQNTSVFRAYWAPQRYPWLHEGLGVWFARQRAFVTQAEFFERAPGIGVAATILPSPTYGGSDLRFAYVAWRNFLDFLDQTYGHATFLTFVHAANRDPKNLDELFRSAFKQSFKEAAANFETAVLMGEFEPRE